MEEQSLSLDRIKDVTAAIFAEYPLSRVAVLALVLAEK